MDSNIAFIKTDMSLQKPYGSFYWSDLVIYNYKLKKIVSIYPKIGPSSNVIIDPNQAWSIDDKKILFTLSSANIPKPPKGQTDEFYDFAIRNNGLYILDIKTGAKTLVTKDSNLGR